MKTLIFGEGYTGSRLKKLIPNSRSTELPELCTGDQIPFDFNASHTWSNLPDFDQAIITFKMADKNLAERFATLLKDRKTILLSSARNLKNSKADEIISEQSPLKNSARSQAESFFEQQAIFLYLGLIWGPERLPEKWISEGRIKNGNKFINFINVEDLCKIIVHFLDSNINSDSFLVSDGLPLRWSEVMNDSELPCSETGLESRRFNTEKLQKSLPAKFVFTRP